MQTGARLRRSRRLVLLSNWKNDAASLNPLCRVLASHQVGEIEEQLTSARRELARSEEANQKLQRDVKEVRLAPRSRRDDGGGARAAGVP